MLPLCVSIREGLRCRDRPVAGVSVASERQASAARMALAELKLAD